MNSLVKKVSKRFSNNDIISMRENPFDNVPRFNESEIKESDHLPSFRNSNLVN
jgi:hypothetical protein